MHQHRETNHQSEDRSAFDSSILDRRGVLLAGAAGALIGVSPALAGSRRMGMSNPELGYDAEAGMFVLPPLPYASDALEPHIDEQTMRIHHDKHHAGYVRKLNAAMDEMKKIRSGEGDAGLIDHWTRELNFNAGGHLNHVLFWRGMAPTNAGGGGRPQGELARAIDRDFGSFDAFSAHFRAAAGAIRGSGWGWLCLEPVSGRLVVTHMHNQEDGLFAGLVPLLGVDVWEHAYYLRYQNERGRYVEAFMNVVNWGEVGRRLDAARTG